MKNALLAKLGRHSKPSYDNLKIILKIRDIQLQKVPLNRSFSYSNEAPVHNIVFKISALL